MKSARPKVTAREDKVHTDPRAMLRAASVAARRVAGSAGRAHQRRGLADLNPPPKPPSSRGDAGKEKASGKAFAVIPGLGLAFGVAHGGFALADELSARSGVTISGVPLAILSGALINNLPGGLVQGALFKPGVAFASSSVLRAGIVAVGAKLSFADVAAVGAFSVPVVAASVGAGLAVIPRLARVAGLSPRLGSLLAVGTSVCGVTAVSALAPAVGATAAETSVAVANVACFGTVGMLLLPQMAHALLGDCPEAAGAFLGTGIHDTAQVFGAALTYKERFFDDKVFETAAVTKLTRNLSLAAAIPALAAGVAATAKDTKITQTSSSSLFRGNVRKAVPPFLLAFLAASVARSAGDAAFAGKAAEKEWRRVVDFVGSEFGAKHCLGTAMAAVGLNLSFAAFSGVGVTPFLVGGAGAVVVSGVGLAGATALAATLRATRGENVGDGDGHR
jgi:uncharacterized integral membrane protein (TIGR00698 family)